VKLAIRNILSRTRGNDATAGNASDGESALEEIARLTAINRERRNPDVERRLAKLRNLAFYELDQVVPESAPEQLIDVEGHRDAIRIEHGLPAVDAADLDALVVRSALLSHGSLLVRGLIPGARASALAAGVDRAFEGRDAALEDNASTKTRPWFYPIEPEGRDSDRITGWGRFDPSVATVWLADSPRMLFELLDSFTDAGVQEVAADYLGEQPAFSVGKSVLRRVGPDGGGAWHQDGAFLGEGIRTLNVWTALSRCGDVAPGLDVVPRRFDEILETGTPGALFDWSVSDELVQEATGGVEPARPIFNPGDALLFDHLCLHGTAIDEAMAETRYATETWCFAPSTYPEQSVPLVI
jgi:hypothetical protein